MLVLLTPHPKGLEHFTAQGKQTVSNMERESAGRSDRALKAVPRAAAEGGEAAATAGYAGTGAKKPRLRRSRQP